MASLVGLAEAGGIEMTNKQDEALLPCPFCGKETTLTKHHKEDAWGLTHRCEVIGPISFSWGSRELHIERWNRRTPASQSQPQWPQFEQCQDAFDAAKNRYPQGNPLGGDHEWHWFQAGWNGRAPVVPDIPTKTMLKAAQKADCDHSPFNEWLQDNGRDFIAMYRAAISAAPTPPLPNCNAA